MDTIGDPDRSDRRSRMIAVHTFDAQLAQGATQPLPTDMTVDGVDEFLTTDSATSAY